MPSKYQKMNPRSGSGSKHRGAPRQANQHRFQERNWNGNNFRENDRYNRSGKPRERSDYLRGYRDGSYSSYEPAASNAPKPRPSRKRNSNAVRNRIPSSQPVDSSALIGVSGVLEIHPNGFGFLRNPKENYARLPADTFVPLVMIRKMNLREGVLIKGSAQPSSDSPAHRLVQIDEIDGMTPEKYAEVVPFDEMTPINPEFWIRLSTGAEPMSTRVMDILTPLGKGQRALIVAPPRSGKTVLLQQICNAVIQNYPNIHVFVLLIDERPEEVTDFRRSVENIVRSVKDANPSEPEIPKAEVVSSSLDCNLESHVRIAQFIIERCKRLTEEGEDVFLLLDSITRLARAFNKWVGNTGRTMSGGIDIRAMDIPKKIFSSARLGEGSGSLTIVGTALVDTGSRMDELIFQEFKGTGNMELVLDRRLADRRVWPAIDISKSGTRREEKLLPPETLQAVNMLRRVLIPMNPVEAMERLVKELSLYESNTEFFKRFIRHE